MSGLLKPYLNPRLDPMDSKSSYDITNQSIKSSYDITTNQ